MSITDTQIYHLEEIRDEMNELMDEAAAIVAATDYIIDGRADIWLKSIRENTQSETNAATLSTTIDELWEDYYNYVYIGEDE